MGIAIASKSFSFATNCKAKATNSFIGVAFLHLLSELYPCSVCAADLRHELNENPPNVESRDDFVEWICKLHNRISKKIGKKKFDCKHHQKRWRRDHNYSWHDIEEREELGPVELDDDD